MKEPQPIDRTITRILRIVVFILAMAFIGTGCRAKKETVKEVSTLVDITKKDSSHTEVVNRAIDDKVYLRVPQLYTAKPECDSICNVAMQDMLRQLEISKKSGDNWYRMYYNEKERRMEFEAQMAETRNVATATNQAQKTDKSHELIKEIPVPYVPDPVKWLAITGAASIVFFIIWVSLKIRQWLQKLKMPIS